MLKTNPLSPRTYLIEDNTPRGYQADQFSDACTRYLPPHNRNIHNTTYQNNDLDEKKQPQQNENVAVAKSELSPRQLYNVLDVAVANTPLGTQNADSQPPPL